jgi:hypothetical protein
MSERDDEVLRRYRALGREAPPARIDATILAASHAAVKTRGTPRWAVPVSVAAVLVLALGLVLETQRRAPEEAMMAPGARPEEPPMVQAAPARAAAQSQEPRAERNDLAPPPAAAATPPSAAAARAPMSAPMQSKPQAFAPAKPAAPSVKVEKDAAVESPEHALERIATLRAEHRDEEADKALEAFRRDHPGYRIAPAMWERVRRR